MKPNSASKPWLREEVCSISFIENPRCIHSSSFLTTQRKDETEAIPSVLYRPRYVSEMKPPSNVPKLQVPLKMLMTFVAVIDLMLNTVVRYTNKFDDVPIVPSFSNVSLPKVQFPIN
ncbi:hypothetical protein CASFOL_038313 [Castilleja foliolosa]|uniref:Uncharacterized protein n=1 Tax=Castilleja foliolosa TaxID=1961234 RepID=A0ABD3BL45_9LAMI